MRTLLGEPAGDRRHIHISQAFGIQPFGGADPGLDPPKQRPRQPASGPGGPANAKGVAELRERTAAQRRFEGGSEHRGAVEQGDGLGRIELTHR